MFLSAAALPLHDGDESIWSESEPNRSKGVVEAPPLPVRDETWPIRPPETEDGIAPADPTPRSDESDDPGIDKYKELRTQLMTALSLTKKVLKLEQSGSGPAPHQQ